MEFVIRAHLPYLKDSALQLSGKYKQNYRNKSFKENNIRFIGH